MPEPVEDHTKAVETKDATANDAMEVELMEVLSLGPLESESCSWPDQSQFFFV